MGEAWHDPRAWLAGDELDGVMNYGLTKALIDYLVDGALTARQAASRLTRLFFRTTSISARMMMNLLDSHDTDRFLTLLRGDRQRLKLALCLLFFFPGMPCVYYGDEIGMTGGYDPDCRKGFIWDETAWDADLRRHVQLLARLKTGGRLAGDSVRISASGDVLTLEREELTAARQRLQPRRALLLPRPGGANRGKRLCHSGCRRIHYQGGINHEKDACTASLPCAAVRLRADPREGSRAV